MSEITEVIRADRNLIELEIRKLGKKIKGKSCQCPVHDDANPSASLYQGEDGAWRVKCHSCGFCGDVFDIRAKLHGRDVAEELKEATGTQRQAAPAKRIFPTVDAIVASVGNLGAIEGKYEYANPETSKIEIVQIRYRCREEDRKKFLVHHAVAGGFVLGAPPKPWPLYNRSRIRAAETVVVVEGEKCVHALHKIGIVATTSLSGAGNADKSDWSPLAGKEVYCWRDFDEQGEKYIRAVIAKLDALNPRPRIYCMDVSTLGLDEGGDVADYLERDGAGADFWDVLRDGSDLVGTGTELDARIADLICGKWKSLPWPWPVLSRLSKSLFPGTILTFCGDPAVSKSFFILQAAEWWHRNGISVALLEAELGIETHMIRLLAMLANKWDILDDDWCRSNAAELLALREKHRAALDSFRPCLFDRFTGRFAYPNVLEWIKERCEAGDKIICVDPITAVDSGESRFNDDHKFIRDAAEMIRQYGARLILVTHPRGGLKGRVTQDDVAGGRAYSRHTQAVLWLMAEDPAKPKRCMTDLGPAQIECNRSVFIAKTSHGKGNKLRIGFTLGAEVLFTEQGVITKTKEQAIQ